MANPGFDLVLKIPAGLATLEGYDKTKQSVCG